MQKMPALTATPFSLCVIQVSVIMYWVSGLRWSFSGGRFHVTSRDNKRGRGAFLNLKEEALRFGGKNFRRCRWKLAFWSQRRPKFLAFASVEVSRYFSHCQEGLTSIEEKSTPCVWLSHSIICQAFAERPSGDRMTSTAQIDHLRNCAVTFKPSQQ